MADRPAIREVPAAPAAGTRLSTFLIKLILISVLPVFILAAGLGLTLIETAEREDSRHADDLTQDAISLLDQDFTSKINGLNLLANAPSLDDRETWLSFYLLAQGFKDSFGSHVVVADTGSPMRMQMNTREPFGTPLPLMPQPAGQAAAPQALATGEAAIGDMFVGPVANTPMIAIAVPALRGGKAEHIILTTMETRQIQRRFEHFTLPPGWTLSIRDGHGDLIARLGPEIPASPATADAVYRVVAASKVSKWSAVLEIPRDVRNAPFRAAAAYMALALFLMGGMSVLGGTVAGRTLGQQVDGLTTEADAGAAASIVEIAQAGRLLDQSARMVRESSERFMRLFENVPLAQAFASLDGEITIRNAQFETLFGYAATNLSTMDDWWRLAYPDPEYRSQIKALWSDAVTRAAREQRGMEPIECWITCHDGRERLVQVSGIFMTDGMLASFVDITEHRRAEDILRDSEAKYRLLAEHAADCIVWTTPDNRIHYISPASSAIFGHRPEAFTANPHLMLDLIHPDDAAAYAHHLRPDCANHTNEMEFRVVFPDGSEHWIAHRCWPVHDSEGRYLGRHAINRDVTQARREEEERHRLVTALRQAGLPILMLDANRRVTFANQACLSLYGYAADEFIGMPLGNLVPADPASQAEHEQLFQVLSAEDIWTGELTRLGRDGKPLPLFATVTALRGLDGRLTGYVVGYIDLRPLKSQQNALRDTIDRLTIANQELERIAVVAAHDLREPARSVSMYAQMLERRCAAQLDSKGLDYLHYLSTGAQRIYNLIGGLLEFSRLPAQSSPTVPISVAAACSAALANLDALIGETGAEIVVAPLPKALGDESLVVQIFQNLIGNALKFGHMDRRLRIEVTAERDGPMWRVSVLDNGIGFDPEPQDVFELFRQLPAGRVAGGIGAGLAICKRMVTRLGGSIWATSIPGHGSSFHFTLPAIDAPRRPAYEGE